MASILTIVEAGKALGLTGQELRNWVAVRESEEKAKEEREREEKQKEREERKAKEEKEREERAAEREVRKAEIANEKVRLERESIQPASPGVTNAGDRMTSTPTLKLPYFTEGVDSMDTYLSRFEMLATSSGIPKSSWAASILGFIRGKALDVCLKLSDSEIKNYDVVKEALMKLYGNTSDGYREKFFSIRPSQGEDPQLFITNLSLFFDRWVALSGARKKYKDLRQLILVDRAVDACHKDVVAFLKEKGPKTLEDVNELLCKYRSAHPDRPIAKSDTDHRQDVSCFMKTVPHPDRGRGVSPKSRNRSRDQHDTDKSCYSCGRVGHLSRDRRGRAGSSGSPCYLCNGRGHIARNCPKSRRNSPRRDVEQSRYVGDSRHGLSERVHQSMVVQGKGYGLTLYHGFVGDTPVEVLRDTGSTMVGVRRTLVQQNEYTGRTGYCMSFVGGMHELPMARIKILTPFYAGMVDAFVIDNPPCDVILGNIPGVINCSEAEVEVWVKHHAFEGNNYAVISMIPVDIGKDRYHRVPTPDTDGSHMSFRKNEVIEESDERSETEIGSRQRAPVEYSDNFLRTVTDDAIDNSVNNKPRTKFRKQEEMVNGESSKNSAVVQVYKSGSRVSSTRERKPPLRVNKRIDQKKWQTVENGREWNKRGSKYLDYQTSRVTNRKQNRSNNWRVCCNRFPDDMYDRYIKGKRFENHYPHHNVDRESACECSDRYNEPMNKLGHKRNRRHGWHQSRERNLNGNWRERNYIT